MIYIVEGDLLDYNGKVDIIVNAWNINFIPHRLLVTHGVSKRIKEVSGLKPFDEVQKHGFLKLGEAVLTGPGELNCKGIIHIAGIDIFWNSSEKATRASARNIVRLMSEHNFSSIAVPLLGCGANKLDEGRCIEILLEELKSIEEKEVYIVRYKLN